MRRYQVLLLPILLAMTLVALPASAAAPLSVSITADEVIGSGGLFTTSGTATAAGAICAGVFTTDDYIGPAHGTDPIKFEVHKKFHCDSGGTFTLRLKVKLYADSTTTATWRVIGGTAAYSGLSGHGTLIGTPIVPGVSIQDEYTGKLR